MLSLFTIIICAVALLFGQSGAESGEVPWVVIVAFLIIGVVFGVLALRKGRSQSSATTQKRRAKR